MDLAEPPEGVERSLWLYELCRFLTMKANNIIIAFFSENPPCSAQTCPEMRASEWQYLCAVHDPPKSCCAIDYCCHTLDWATNILTSPKYFPSRLTLGSEAGGGPQASMKHLTNIFRRLYRIFAHAWFQHRDVFWQVEGHDGLYVFFKTVCDVYNLIPEDNYTIPAEAEGIDSQEGATAGDEPRKMTLLQRDSDSTTPAVTSDDMAGAGLINSGATTRRHKHTPSTGASVTTISEGVEEGAEEDDSKQLPNLEEDSVLELPKVTEQDDDTDKAEIPAEESPITNGVPIEILAEEPEEEENVKDEATDTEFEESGDITTQLATETDVDEPTHEEKPETESGEGDIPVAAADDDNKTDEAVENPNDPEPEAAKTETDPETPTSSTLVTEPPETETFAKEA